MSDEKLPTLKPEELIKAPKKMGLFLFQKIKRQSLSIQAPGWPKDKGSSSQRERHWQRSFKKNLERCGCFRGGIEEVIVMRQFDSVLIIYRSQVGGNRQV